ncbi:MAG: wax ester/triacylglycerol synthase family O-acyltransferase [Candidatus Dormiibacterota bacterium]
MTEPLSAADRSSLAAEHGPVNMAIAAVIELEGGPQVNYDAICDRIGQRIHLMPRYRQRLETPILGLSNPVWVDDENFDIRWHVRLAKLPAPGDYDALSEYVARESSRLMDRSRPLWEIHLVEGLTDGRVALVPKVHHALVDGLALLGVGMILLDAGPQPTPVEPPPEKWRPRPNRMRRHLARMALSPVALGTRVALDSADKLLDATPGTVVRDLRRATELVGELARIRPGAPRLPINRPISANRAYAMTTAPLVGLKTAAKAAGGTVNDGILAAVSGMLAGYLRKAGVNPRSLERDPVALVPVSVRQADDDPLGNRVSVVFVDLPIGTTDPVRRVKLIHQRMERIKGSAKVEAGALMVEMVGFAPPLLSSLVSRAGVGGGAFNLVVSNVPGPQFPFYVDGARVLAVHPAVPLNPADQGLNVGIVSYDGKVCFGLMADRDLNPPVSSARIALDKALAELTG